MRGFGQEGNGRREARATGVAAELEDAHLQIDRVATDRQVLDAFPGAGLMDGFGDFATVGTEADPMLGADRETVVPRVGFRLAMQHVVIGQAEQIGPKLQSRSSHGSPSGSGDPPKSTWLNHPYYYTLNRLLSPKCAENRFLE